jgi:hypothetical protein
MGNPVPFPDENPLDGYLMTVQFSEAWLPAIVGALNGLYYSGFWVSPPADSKDQIDKLIEMLSEDMPPVPQVFPVRAFMHHIDDTVLAGNAIAITVDTGNAYNLVAQQTASAINDSFAATFLLDAGTYTVLFLHDKTASSGKMTITFDGVSIGVIDLYNASTLRNLKSSISGVVVAAAGGHEIVVTIASKNASSAGYNCPLQAYWVVGSG